VNANGGGDVQIVHEAGEHEILKIQVVEVPAIRAAMPGMSGITRQVVRPRPDAALSRLVHGGVVITHCGAADRAPGQFLEEICELFAFAAALPLPAQERHVLNTVEQGAVDDLRVVADNDLLPYGAPIGLEFSDVFADNRPVAQQLVDVALMPNGFSRVPCRDAFLSQRPNNDPAPVALHVHVEDTTDELRSVFEHMKLAVTHLEPPRTLTRRNDSFPRKLTLRLPVRKRPERLVLRLTVRTHHVRKDREEGRVRGEVQDDVLRCEPDSDAMLRDVQEQHQRLIHPVSCQSVERLRDKHRTWRNLAVFNALEEAAKLSGLRVVAAKSRDADVLQCFGDRQAMGFDEPHGGVVLPPFAIAPCL
jgi:hypothetical protein